jgi:hypothetical protein
MQDLLKKNLWQKRPRQLFVAGFVAPVDICVVLAKGLSPDIQHVLYVAS